MATHTPLPWAIDPASDDTIAIYSPAGDFHVCTLEMRYDPDEPLMSSADDKLEESRREGDAELIVRAVNAHADLLAACKEAALWLVHDFRCTSRRAAPCDCHMGRIEAAIAKAEGGS